MTDLSLQFATREDFATLFFQDGEIDCLFVPHVLDAETGSALDLEIAFQPEWVAFRMSVEVLWKRAKGQSRPFLRPGTCVAFPQSEWEKLDRLLAYIERQEIEFVHRTAPRVPLTLEVHYRSNRLRLTDTARDLSLDGMYLATKHVLLIGDRLDVKFRVPGKILPLTLQAEVVRKDDDGVGLRFNFAKESERDYVRRLVGEARNGT
ncbi:MAG: PilZ domain-containing protein, partial [Myxococcales bacterium]|nr:PilZ domain-containing protein [Myxococcales bacterium]